MRNLVAFYKDKEVVDKVIAANTLALSRCEFKKNEILSKGFISLTAGFLISLIVCPQFGFGVPSGHGVFHFFWVISPLLCAVVCGIVLYLSGILTLALTLNKFERLWFFHKTRGGAIFLPVILWSGFMMLPKTHHFSLSYSLFWFIGFLLLMPLTKRLAQRMVWA